jgi:hypothetical protein
VDVADLQAKAGDADGASRTLGLAIEAAEGLDEMFGVSGLALVGSALAERGDERAGKVLARAEAQAEKLEGTDWVIVLPEVADAFASAGDFAHADALAKRLAKGRGKTEAGLLDSARHHADQAEGSIALRQAASGDAKGAIARARAIEDPESRARVLADIAASIDDPAARLDARLAALEASRQVTYPDARVLLLADVARALARSGDLAPAKEAMGNAQAGVGEIADGKRLLDALFAMAGGWHAVGDAKRTDETLGAAKQLIEERLPVRQGDVAWAALARTAAGVGRFDTAFDAVGHVGDATGAALALASIGEAAARASNAAALGDAATNLQALVDAWPEDIRRAKDTAQGRLALLLARQGRLDDAAARLDAIASPYQTVLAATGIARALPR